MYRKGFAPVGVSVTLRIILSTMRTAMVPRSIKVVTINHRNGTNKAEEEMNKSGAEEFINVEQSIDAWTGGTRGRGALVKSSCRSWRNGE